MDPGPARGGRDSGPARGGEGDAPPGADRRSRDSLEEGIRRLLAAGDRRGAAAEAVRGYGPEILRYLRGLLGSESDAQEAFSASAERLWQGLASYRGEASMRTWAFRLAWSAASDLRKEAWRARGRRLGTSEAAGLAADGRTRSHLRAEARRSSLEALRSSLPLEDQCLLQLRVDRGLSWADCAHVLAREGRPARPEALMKRYQRIKDRLGRMARERRGP